MYIKMRLPKKKKNTKKIITNICFMKFPIHVPLCKMISMEVVCLIIENNVTLLAISFIKGYIPSSSSFYVSLEHEDGHMHEVMKETHNTWDDVWKKKNEEFEECLVENNFQ